GGDDEDEEAGIDDEPDDLAAEVRPRLDLAHSRRVPHGAPTAIGLNEVLPRQEHGRHGDEQPDGLDRIHVQWWVRRSRLSAWRTSVWMSMAFCRSLIRRRRSVTAFCSPF